VRSAAASDEPRVHDPSHDTSLRADLPPLVRLAVDATTPPGADARTVLQAVYEISALRELELGTLAVRSDARWFATFSHDDRPGASIVELRRWPGDTVIALYSVAPTGEESSWPPVPGARLVAQADSAEPTWTGSVDDGNGARPALWIERSIERADSRLAALVLLGDAGLGMAAVPTLEAEARFLVSRVEVRPAAWRQETPLAAGTLVRVPSAGLPPRDHDETTDAWQIVVGAGFTLGLPPGFRAYRLDLGVPAAEQVPGALLWFRGRFRDRSGMLVAVGDERRYGYVAAIESPSQAWSTGGSAPRGAPGALAASRPVPAPELAQSVGAAAASVERWRDPRFDGDWIVFKIRYEAQGVEIGLPVLGGRRSPSLFWIGQSFRPEGWPAAPPPVDPARRFGIDFARLTPSGRKSSPWVEGYLHVPGLRADVSRGLVPSASLRSTDGYPVRFQGEDGRALATLRRLASAEVEPWIASRSGIVEVEKPARYRAARVVADRDGARLFVDAVGQGFVFELEPGASAEVRERWRIMMDSVRLERK
jgi:hypothetical protein